MPEKIAALQCIGILGRNSEVVGVEALEGKIAEGEDDDDDDFEEDVPKKGRAQKKTFYKKSYVTQKKEGVQKKDGAKAKEGEEKKDGVLKDMLKDKDEKVHLATIEAIGKVSLSSAETAVFAMPLLVKAFDNVKEDVKRVVVDVFGQICYVNPELSAQAVDKVVRALKDRSEGVQKCAIKAIKELVKYNPGETATKAFVGYMKARGSMGDFAAAAL